MRRGGTVLCSHQRRLFQSSPAPRGECDSMYPRDRRPACCFNPHPPRGASATKCRMRRSQRLYRVSILTRPEGRVRPTRPSRGTATANAFQSSPAPRGECDSCAPRTCASPRRFNPHPPRGASATMEALGPRTLKVPNVLFQSSPAPRGECDLLVRVVASFNAVSILTHPGGRARRPNRQARPTSPH